MSIRTKEPYAFARAMMARMFSTHTASSVSRPIWVSFTETLASAPATLIRSSVSRYVSRAACASAALCTDSPSRSRLAESPAAFRSFNAATPASTVSPATKRLAKRRANPLPRMNWKTRDCSLSHSRAARSISGLGMELRVALRLLAQHVARREARTVALGEPLELAHDARGAEVVGVPQRAAAERREPEAENGADVAVAGAAHDPLPHPARGFVQHHEDQPLDDLGGSGAPVGMGTDQFVHGGIHAPLLAARVLVESLPHLAAEPTALDHAGERRNRREPHAELPVHDPYYLLSHVHLHLVGQSE